MWRQTYDVDGDQASSFFESSEGGYAMAGLKSDNLWLCKTDEDGLPEFPSWVGLPVFISSPLFFLLSETNFQGKD